MKLTEELKSFIQQHRDDDVHQLALQSSKYTGIDIYTAICQIAGMKVAKEKIPTWYKNPDILYPQHLPLEQCSSEMTARYKAGLVDGESLVDLTGGFGVDCAFLSMSFNRVTYVEQQEDLAAIAKHNFDTLSLKNVQVINSNSVAYLEAMDPVSLIYIDPARRSTHGRKTVLIEDCAPNLLEIETLLDAKADKTLIKLSPMLDIAMAVKYLHNVTDVYVISHLNECKELVFQKSKDDKPLHIHCVNICNEHTDVFSFSSADEKELQISYTNQLGKYLYEPNSSIIKAGAYKSITTLFSINKLHPSSHLYTSDVLNKDFHGRVFEIVGQTALNKKHLKMVLEGLKQANITTRNFPLSVQDLRKRLQLKDGGDTYIFATTLYDGQKRLFLCRKIK